MASNVHCSMCDMWYVYVSGAFVVWSIFSNCGHQTAKIERKKTTKRINKINAHRNNSNEYSHIFFFFVFSAFLIFLLLFFAALCAQIQVRSTHELTNFAFVIFLFCKSKVEICMFGACTVRCWLYLIVCWLLSGDLWVVLVYFFYICLSMYAMYVVLCMDK